MDVKILGDCSWSRRKILDLRGIIRDKVSWLMVPNCGFLFR